MWKLLLIFVLEGEVRGFSETRGYLYYEQCRDQAYTARYGGPVALCIPEEVTFTVTDILPGTTAPPAPLSACRQADQDGDGVVGLADLSLFQEQVGKSCE